MHASCICIYIYTYDIICMHVFMYVIFFIQIVHVGFFCSYIYDHRCTYIYIYIYIRVCVCLCVCLIHIFMMFALNALVEQTRTWWRAPTSLVVRARQSRSIPCSPWPSMAPCPECRTGWKQMKTVWRCVFFSGWGKGWHGFLMFCIYFPYLAAFVYGKVKGNYGCDCLFEGKWGEIGVLNIFELPA